MDESVLKMAKLIVQQQAELERLRAKLIRKTPKQKKDEEEERKQRVLGLVTRMYKAQEQAALKKHGAKIKELQELAKANGSPIPDFEMSTEVWDDLLRNFR